MVSALVVLRIRFRCGNPAIFLFRNRTNYRNWPAAAWEEGEKWIWTALALPGAGNTGKAAPPAARHIAPARRFGRGGIVLCGTGCASARRKHWQSQCHPAACLGLFRLPAATIFPAPPFGTPNAFTLSRASAGGTGQLETQTAQGRCTMKQVALNQLIVGMTALMKVGAPVRMWMRNLRSGRRLLIPAHYAPLSRGRGPSRSSGCSTWR